MTKLTIEDLTQIARDFLRAEYGLSLEIPIKRNNRLSSSMGRYIESFDEDKVLRPNRIEIGGKLFEYGADEAIVGTLKHELVHYALAVKGEPNDDGHPHFESELKRINAPATETATIGETVIFRCEGCGKVDGGLGKQFVKNAPTAIYYYRSKCCRAKLTYINTVIMDGTKSVKELIAEGAYV